MGFGHNRHGKKGKTQLVYGVLTGRGGLAAETGLGSRSQPGGQAIAVQVYPGNTSDPATVPDRGS